MKPNLKLKTSASILAILGCLSSFDLSQAMDQPCNTNDFQKQSLKICQPQELNVLSLDGGGIRGILEAVQLTYLEKATGKQCHELFDVFTGTSTGGILAAALSIGIPAENMLYLYMKCGNEIFKKGTGNHLNHKGVYNTQYDHKFLEETLKLLTKECDFKTSNGNDDLLIKKRLLITGYDLKNGSNVMADSSDPSYQVNKLYEILRMTSAAPTFFDPAKIKKNVTIDSINTVIELEECCDGGVYANNPAEEALALLIDQLNKQTNFAPFAINIVSLGTGNTAAQSSTSMSNKSALFSWTSKLIDDLFTSEAIKAEARLTLTYENNKNLKLAYENQGQKMLGAYLNHYCRSQSKLTDKDLHAMDQADNLDILEKFFNVGLDQTKTTFIHDVCQMLDLQEREGKSAQQIIIEIKDGLTQIDISKNKLEIDKKNHEDKLALFGIVNGYVLQNDEQKRKVYLDSLKNENAEADYLNLLLEWTNSMKQVNTEHDANKSIYSKAWGATVGWVVTGKHAELNQQLLTLETWAKNKLMTFSNNEKTKNDWFQRKTKFMEIIFSSNKAKDIMLTNDILLSICPDNFGSITETNFKKLLPQHIKILEYDKMSYAGQISINRQIEDINEIHITVSKNIYNLFQHFINTCDHEDIKGKYDSHSSPYLEQICKLYWKVILMNLDFSDIMTVKKLEQLSENLEQNLAINILPYRAITVTTMGGNLYNSRLKVLVDSLKTYIKNNKK